MCAENSNFVCTSYNFRLQCATCSCDSSK